MRGVVIWYSPTEFKAIIWCEDSRALAFANGATAWRNPMVEHGVGDDVSFDVILQGENRIARDITLTEPRAAPDLAQRIAALRPRPQPAKAQNPLLHLCASRD